MFNRVSWLAVLVALGLIGRVAYGGVIAERTRVIVPGDHREASLALVNQNAYPVVVQAWIDNGDMASTPDTSTAPIMPLPPVFRLEPGQQRSLRLIVTGQGLAQERESLYWLNVYEIPPLPSEELEEGMTRLTITVRTQLKVIYRPGKIAEGAEQAPLRLVVHGKPHSVQIQNPTPFYITLTHAEVRAGTRSVRVKTPLLEPFSTQHVLADSPVSRDGTFHFSWLDDDGNTQAGTLPMQ